MTIEGRLIESALLCKQNLNGRETEDELYEAGIKAGAEEGIAFAEAYANWVDSPTDFEIFSEQYAPYSPPATARLMRPTEEELRAHFGDKLPATARLMRPAYTTIWALEDGTLLWDWRGGFATLGERPKPAKSAERYEATPYGLIASQRETIKRQNEERAELKKQLSLVRAELSMLKSNT